MSGHGPPRKPARGRMPPMQGACTTRTLASEFARNVLHQFLGAGHGAGQRIAHAHRNRRRRQFAFLHDIEMRVEGRNLIDLGERHLHFGGERREMSGRKIAVLILNQMQMLDQQIAPARPIGSSARTSTSACGSTCRPFGVRGGRRRPPRGTARSLWASGL